MLSTVLLLFGPLINNNERNTVWHGTVERQSFPYVLQYCGTKVPKRLFTEFEPFA